MAAISHRLGVDLSTGGTRSAIVIDHPSEDHIAAVRGQLRIAEKKLNVSLVLDVTSQPGTVFIKLCNAQLISPGEVKRHLEAVAGYLEDID
jgi:aspartate carbamoyltransferase regulatory subunit